MAELIPNQSIAQARFQDGFCPDDLTFCQPIADGQMTRGFWQPLPITGTNLVTDPTFQNTASWGNQTGFASQGGGGAILTSTVAQTVTPVQSFGVAQNRFYRVSLGFRVTRRDVGSNGIMEIYVEADSTGANNRITFSNCVVGVDYTFTAFYFTDEDPAIFGDRMFMRLTNNLLGTVEIFINNITVIELGIPLFSIRDCNGVLVQNIPTIQAKIADPTLLTFTQVYRNQSNFFRPFSNIYSGQIGVTINWDDFPKGCYTVCWAVGDGDLQCSECFDKGCQTPLITLRYSGDGNQFGFSYFNGLPPQEISFVAVLHSPDYVDEINDSYLFGDGSKISTFIHNRKVFKLATGRMPEYMHDAIRIALSHPNLFLNGDAYYRSGDYSPNWNNDSLLASVEVEVEQKTQNTFGGI